MASKPLSSDQRLLLHCSLIDGVGPVAIRHVLDALRARSLQLSDLNTFGASDVVAQCGVTPAVARKLVVGLRDTCSFERELTLLEQHSDIRLFTFIDDAYPELLREIYAAPPVLYVRGHFDEHIKRTSRQAVAVIGSRKANAYGQRAINHLVPALVERGLTIVSGGALGADSMAHLATLQAGGVTYAVLGAGLLKPYPMRNRALFERIVSSGGLLISPFPLQMEAMPGNFPARNRIIAGLSRACVVIQAAAKSGAIITAHYALEQGREVFAVPGHIDDPLSAGCHTLLAQGAGLAASANTIVEQLGITQNRVRIADAIVGQEAQEDATDERSASVQHSLLTLCQQPCNVDQLAVQSGNSLADVQRQLFDLQLAGMITQTPSGQWQAL